MQCMTIPYTAAGTAISTLFISARARRDRERERGVVDADLEPGRGGQPVLDPGQPRRAP
ncbi:hypothetical protein GCM10020218_065010 [Dactylosporangium vinaceum]